MIDYVYTAKDKQTGEQKKGKISADNKSAAAAVLMEKSLYPIKIEEAAQAEPIWHKNIFGTTVKPRDRVIFTRQLATMVKAGLPITQALNTATSQIPKQEFKNMLQKITASVEGGNSLAKSFAMYPKVFNDIYVNLVDAGEQSGNLDDSLKRLADQQEKEQKIISKVRGALWYPMIVMVVIIGVLIFMITTVLPQVANLYKELNQKLPALTSSLLSFSNFAIQYWYVFALLIAAMVFGLRAYIHTSKGRYYLDKFKLSAPLVGTLFKKVYAARFTRTLSSLVNSGVPLLRSLKIASEAVDNKVIEKIINNAAEEVKSGGALSSALSGKPEILSLVPQMIQVGEESGSLGSMLEKVSSFYEDDVDQAVKNISATIEPVMIVFLGVVVIIIVVAVLFPIYGLVTNIGSGSGGGSGGI